MPTTCFVDCDRCIFLTTKMCRFWEQWRCNAWRSWWRVSDLISFCQSPLAIHHQVRVLLCHVLLLLVFRLEWQFGSLRWSTLSRNGPLSADYDVSSQQWTAPKENQSGFEINIDCWHPLQDQSASQLSRSRQYWKCSKLYDIHVSSCTIVHFCTAQVNGSHNITEWYPSPPSTRPIIGTLWNSPWPRTYSKYWMLRYWFIIHV